MKIINLLPQKRQEELRYEDLFRSVATAAAVAAIIMAVVLLMLLGVRMYLSYQTRTTLAQIEEGKKQAAKQEYNDLKQKIRLINLQMNDFKNLADSTPAWSRVLLALAGDIPEGVEITSLKADVATRKMTINGFAPTREQVLQLYSNIHQDSERFSEIDYPLENVARPTDVRFHFTFLIQEELLKKQP